MIVSGFAKVNLSLRVRRRDDSGFHPLLSLVQSIGWADRVSLVPSDGDEFTVDGSMVAETSNLAWRAVEAVRSAAGSDATVRLHLEKRIPVAAGLGGGSADAAAALVAAGALFRVGHHSLTGLAPGLGSDVPFCLVGGSAWMEGRGERIAQAAFTPDFFLAVVVPDFELSTAAVYRRWDDLEAPEDRSPAGGRDLPPSLREAGPLVNDLLPAALSLRPDLGDFMADLALAWGRPVLLSGSGPACFAFFADAEEAAEATGLTPPVRSAWSGAPADRGWRIDDEG
ncbi:MAG: 4-(cytidine 5'-diphospho)-2-C-methyl-D-erythritol kinase [Acidimicrobiia bacterium]|nr:MAG: 4-(cytidine 5'-diphospho)-2-C-methyl-D-erythritol kinase [Acidimicrobiia bacterium]